ncbi:MAG: electron transport complex subunit RsxC [Acidobacteriota bacterium]|nr:electron transport complex subunit RsxC [Acidobacteriota bacterium]
MMQAVAGFRHGVHPREHKTATNGIAVERMPFVDTYTIPLSQHIGAPSLCLVQPGQLVVRGQMIAAPNGFISTAQHAPVTGEVTAVERRPHPTGDMVETVVIETDPYDDQHIRAVPPNTTDLVQAVQNAGIVGLGGAAFPSHVKLTLPEGKHAEFVIINGCECEPYLTCDHRLMLEQAEDVVDGLRLIMNQLGAEQGYIGIEENKGDAVDMMIDLTLYMEDIHIVPLKVKYPQGAEKMLIDAVLKREVPVGKLPIDIEVVSYNVGSTAAMAQLVKNGIPLVERIVTVTGPAVGKPRNLIVPVGTPIREVLDYCDTDYGSMQQLVLGGPMMGQAQKDLDAPVIKGTSGLLALDECTVARCAELPCIRCGRCLEACPMFLNPSRLAQMVRAGWVEELTGAHQTNCFECGACSYVCPSHIPLVQLMRLGKAMIREEQKKRPA